jgi:hypothetical protein
MKRIKLAAAALLLAGLGILAVSVTGCADSDKQTQSGAQSAQKDAKTVQYTCSMHPEIVRDKPGDCPKCGMKLVEKR